jgi:hypothetical protein
MPRHIHGLYDAIEWNGRLCTIMARVPTAEWRHVYSCLVGYRDVQIGRGLLKICDIAQNTALMAEWQEKSGQILLESELDAPESILEDTRRTGPIKIKNP